MKYKIGDKVKIIDNLRQNKFYCMDDNPYKGIFAASGMVDIAGSVVTIKSIGRFDGFYRINGYCYLWVDEMFERACMQDNKKMDFALDVRELLK